MIYRVNTKEKGMKDYTIMFLVALFFFGIPFFIWNIWLWHYLYIYLGRDNTDKYYLLEDYLYFLTWVIPSLIVSYYAAKIHDKYHNHKGFWSYLSISYLIYFILTLWLLLPFGSI